MPDKQAPRMNWPRRVALLTFTALFMTLTVTAWAETVKTSRGTVTVVFMADGVAAALPDKTTGKYYTYAYADGNATATVSAYPSQEALSQNQPPEGTFTREPADLRALMKEPEKLAQIFFENNPYAVTTEKAENKKKNIFVVGVQRKLDTSPKYHPDNKWPEKPEAYAVATSRGTIKLVITPYYVSAEMWDETAQKRYEYWQYRDRPNAWVSIIANVPDRILPQIESGFKRAPLNLTTLRSAAKSSSQRLLQLFEGSAIDRDLGNRLTGGITLLGKPKFERNELLGNTYTYQGGSIRESMDTLYRYRLYDPNGRMVAMTDSDDEGFYGTICIPETKYRIRGYYLDVYDSKGRDVLRRYTIYLAQPFGLDTVFRIPCGEILEAVETNPHTNKTEKIDPDKYRHLDFPAFDP